MYDFVMHLQKLIENTWSDTLTLIQQRFIHMFIIFQQKYPVLFMSIMVVYTPFWFLSMIVRQIYSYIQKKVCFEIFCIPILEYGTHIFLTIKYVFILMNSDWDSISFII